MTRRRHRVGAGLLLVLLGAAVAAPWLSTGDVSAQHPDLALAPPTLSRLELLERLPPTYRRTSGPLPLRWFDGRVVSSADPRQPLMPLGSDSLGRDQWTRLLHGARLSLGLASCGLAGALLLGGIAGLLAGSLGGRTDQMLMRVADLFIAWPALYVVLVMRAAMPLTLPFATLFGLMATVLAIAGWPIVARAVRAVTITERTREYVTAARSAGATPAWILRRHLWPATRAVLVTEALLLLPSFILAEATLSFVGLGFTDPTPSWGTMLKEASTTFVLQQAPWLLSPAAAIGLATLGVNLLSVRRH